MARAQRRKRRKFLPGILVGQVNMMQVGVVFEIVEAAADDMDLAVMRDATNMVACAG